MLVLPKHLPVKTSQVKTDTHDFLQQHTQTPSPCGATPPYPGAGRETHRPTARRPPTRGRAVKHIEKSSPGWMVFPQPPELPLRKRGVRCVGRGGVRGHRVSSPLMYPGPYRPLYLWGLHVGRLQTNRPLPWGGSLAARWSPASLGTVR